MITSLVIVASVTILAAGLGYIARRFTPAGTHATPRRYLIQIRPPAAPVKRAAGRPPWELLDYQPDVPFARWESDTFVGRILALREVAR